MIEGILGTKLGMTQIFNEDGMKVPVTLIEAGTCKVVQVKTVESDGYEAVQIGYIKKNPKRVRKAERGHFKKAEAVPTRKLREFKPIPGKGSEPVSIGDVIDVGMFQEGDFVDVAGTSKGRGFAGVVKRYNFKGGRASHGGSSVLRTPGSIGHCAKPGKVFKGRKMPGQMGNKRIIVQKLKVVKVDLESNLLLIKGAVPGPNGGMVEIIKSRKAGQK